MNPIINKEYIDGINKFKPIDINNKCLLQIKNRWHLFQEITAKTLNAIQLDNQDGFPIIFSQMVKELLIILSYLNTSPFMTLGSYVSEAKKFIIKPQGCDTLIKLFVEGRFCDLKDIDNAIITVFSDLETYLEKNGVELYV